MSNAANYFVRITIAGINYSTGLMSMGACFAAQADANTYGLTAIVMDKTEHPAVTIHDVANNPPAKQQDSSWKEATQVAPVRIKLKYKNHDLAAIMLKLKAELPEDAFNAIELIEDTSTKWAIHTPEEYFFTIRKEVESVVKDLLNNYKSANTNNPDVDLFCSL